MTEIAAKDRRSMTEDGDAEGGNSDEILAGNESFGCSLGSTLVKYIISH